MRIVDKDYKEISDREGIKEGQEVTISEDAWCSYSKAIVSRDDKGLFVMLYERHFDVAFAATKGILRKH